MREEGAGGEPYSGVQHREEWLRAAQLVELWFVIQIATYLAILCYNWINDLHLLTTALLVMAH